MDKSKWEAVIVSENGEKLETILIDQTHTYFLNRERTRNVFYFDEGELVEAENVSVKPLNVFNDEVLSFKEATAMFNFLGYSQKEVAEVLDVDVSTLSRWKKKQKEEQLGKLQSKVVWDIDEVIAKGVKFFGSEEKLKNWLNTPNYALGDVKPVDLLKDPYGIEMVENAIEAMSWGNVL